MVGMRYLYSETSLDIFQLTIVILHLDKLGKEISSGGQQWQDRWYHARGVEECIAVRKSLYVLVSSFEFFL